MRLFKSLKNPKKTDAKLPKKSSGLNNRAAIGIDIDQHSIKMVQLSGRSLNQIQLEKYVIAKLPKNIIQGNKVQNYDQLVTYLQQAYICNKPMPNWVLRAKTSSRPSHKIWQPSNN